MLQRDTTNTSPFRRRLDTLSAWFGRNKDFWLLLCIFVTFRLASVLFQRPGGYIRDYSDLIYYQNRASWQDFGFLPYRDYWSEYPRCSPG